MCLDLISLRASGGPGTTVRAAASLSLSYSMRLARVFAYCGASPPGDLSLAGRVVVQTGDDKFTSKLVKIDRPLLRIPSLGALPTYITRLHR